MPHVARDPLGKDTFIIDYGDETDVFVTLQFTNSGLMADPVLANAAIRRLDRVARRPWDRASEHVNIRMYTRTKGEWKSDPYGKEFLDDLDPMSDHYLIVEWTDSRSEGAAHTGRIHRGSSDRTLQHEFGHFLGLADYAHLGRRYRLPGGGLRRDAIPDTHNFGPRAESSIMGTGETILIEDVNEIQDSAIGRFDLSPGAKMGLL